MITFAPELQCRVCNFSKKMMTKDYIRHQGKVERIEKDKVFVRIEQKAACSECHASSVCLVADKKDKVIEVNDYTGSYALQEEVNISVCSSMGLTAVVIAYAIPLLSVILAVVAGLFVSKSEVVGGVTGLSVLVVYYFVLYLMRDKIKKKLVFSLSKIQD